MEMSWWVVEGQSRGGLLRGRHLVALVYDGWGGPSER